jgi:hypothetical protein
MELRQLSLLFVLHFLLEGKMPEFQGKLRHPPKTWFFAARLADLAKLVSQGLEAVYTLYVNPTKILQKIFPHGALAKKKQEGNIHNLDAVAASQVVALLTEIYIQREGL